MFHSLSARTSYKCSPPLAMFPTVILSSIFVLYRLFVFSFLLSFVFFFFHCDNPAREIANIAPSASECGMQKRSGANRDRAKRDGSSVSERRQKKDKKKVFLLVCFLSHDTKYSFISLLGQYVRRNEECKVKECRRDKKRERERK